MGMERRGSSFRRRRNVTAELPKDGNGRDGKGVDGSGVEWLFFPPSQKCEGGTSKGREGIGCDGSGADRRGKDLIKAR